MSDRSFLNQIELYEHSGLISSAETDDLRKMLGHGETDYVQNYLAGLHDQNTGTGLTGDRPRNPADNQLPPFDCPTGTCAEDKVCEEVEESDDIDPFGRAHVERNACNKCPSSHPTEIWDTIDTNVDGQSLWIFIQEYESDGTIPYSQASTWRHYLEKGYTNLVIADMNRTLRTSTARYEDHTRRIWGPDHWFTAPQYHGDAGIMGERVPEYMTFRLLQGQGDERGWQCRYYGGVLDDTSIDLGTYDYAPAPPKLSAILEKFSYGDWFETGHNFMDVEPHEQNPSYAPNLTVKY